MRKIPQDHLNYGRQVLARWIERIDGVKAVLDVGSGQGFDLDVVARKFPGVRVEGIESNVHYAGTLKAKGYSISNCNIERAPLPFEDETFDLVMANQIMEHTKEVFWIFHQIARVMQVGGHFYLGVPNLASLHNRLLLLLGQQPSCINSASAHVRGFTKPDMLRLLESAWPGGFELVDFGGSNFYPFPPAIATPLADAVPSLSVVIFFLLRKTKAYNGEFIKFPVEFETNFFVGEQVHHVA